MPYILVHPGHSFCAVVVERIVVVGTTTGIRRVPSILVSLDPRSERICIYIFFYIKVTDIARPWSW